MPISKLPPIKEAQVVEWVKIWGPQGKALQVASEHPVLSGAWHILRCVMAAKATLVLGLPEHPIEQPVRVAAAAKGKTIEEWGDESVLVRKIADWLKAKVPEICHAYTDDDLPAWVRCATYHQLAATAPDDGSKRAFIEEGAKAVPLKIGRLLPDNPLRLDETFALYTPKQMASFGLQVSELVRANSPRRAPGRPKGTPKPKKSGRASVDPALAVRACQAERAANKYQSPPWWEKFARKEGIPIPQDENGREALRKKIESWAMKGRRIERKKVGE